MKLPEELWERVMDLATLLVNAGQRDQYWIHYNSLREYCEDQKQNGHDHPFLWETLADFTIDDGVAIDLYKKALELAAGMEGRSYRASILLALAERHRNRGEPNEAREYAFAADEEARLLDDLDLRRSISQFLLSHG